MSKNGASGPALNFYRYCYQIGEQMSGPSIMYKAQLQNGEQIIIDDYREAYFWLKEQTPEDARVMAWWDYGYQITGIANRTSIADGNGNFDIILEPLLPCGSARCRPTCSV